MPLLIFDKRATCYSSLWIACSRFGFWSHETELYQSKRVRTTATLLLRHIPCRADLVDLWHCVADHRLAHRALTGRRECAEWLLSEPQTRRSGMPGLTCPHLGFTPPSWLHPCNPCSDRAPCSTIHGRPDSDVVKRLAAEDAPPFLTSTPPCPVRDTPEKVMRRGLPLFLRINAECNLSFR